MYFLSVSLIKKRHTFSVSCPWDIHFLSFMVRKQCFQMPRTRDVSLNCFPLWAPLVAYPLLKSHGMKIHHINIRWCRESHSQTARRQPFFNCYQKYFCILLIWISIGFFQSQPPLQHRLHCWFLQKCSMIAFMADQFSYFNELNL